MVPEVKILAIRLIRNKDDQKRRGIAFVDVETQEMVEASLGLNGYKIKDKEITVHHSREELKQSDVVARTVYLRNLALTSTEKSLREFITERIGEEQIEEIRLIRNSRDGKIKGYAYIQIATEAACFEAIKKLHQ